MELDSKVWIAIAAVTAALISAIISVVNLVISKDQKTTEFRQEWINSVRIEISNIIALAKSIKAQNHIIDHLGSEPETQKDAIEYISDVVKSYIREMNFSFSKLLLFLNPKEHAHLISLLESLVSLSKIGDKTKNSDVSTKCDLVIVESQRILKKEWTIVKRGELTFFLTKYIFIASLVFLLIVLILKLSGILDISYTA